MSASKPKIAIYRYKERPDDLRSGWRYVRLPSHVPRGHHGEALIRLADYQRLQAECEKLRKELDDSEMRVSALSASACHGGYGDDYGNHRCHYQNRIDHLLSLLRHAQPIIRAHAGASHMLDGFRPKRNQWDELVEGVDAAMQGDQP